MTTTLQSAPLTVVGNRVRVARLALGWSMRAAAAQAGVSPSTWCRIEQGQEPSLTCALRVAQALGYPVEELWKVQQEEAKYSSPEPPTMETATIGDMHDGWVRVSGGWRRFYPVKETKNENKI